MAVTIKFNKAQLKQAREEIQKIRKNLSEIDEPMAKVAIMLDRWVQTNFKSEGGKVGGWQEFALKGRYVKNKGFDSSAKLLQDTGRLRLSFKPFHSKSVAGIGSDLNYAKTHEEGQGVPVRRMLPVQDDVRKQARRLIEHHITKGVRVT